MDEENLHTKEQKWKRENRPFRAFFFLFLEHKRMLTLEINKNEVERARLVKEANFPVFLCRAKFNFVRTLLSLKWSQTKQHGYSKPVSRYDLFQCLCCLLNEEGDHLELWHMLNYFTEVRFQISFYVIIKTCLLVGIVCVR